MKEFVVNFLKEEDGDVVQNVIIIAILAALALVFSGTIKEFVQSLIERIKGTQKGVEDMEAEISGKGQ